MESYADEERSLTGTLFARKPRGYGTAAASDSWNACQRSPKRLFTHLLCSSDTLQGLAVKYDSTVADIKKANRLWNNESLALRESVVIPIFDDKSCPPDVNHVKDEQSQPSKLSPKLVKAVNNGADQPDIMKKTNGLDFFAKYDNSIHTLKAKVAKQVENASSYLDDEDTLFTSTQVPSRASSSSSLDSRDRRSRDSSLSFQVPADGTESHSAAEPVVKSRYRKKLDNFERRQDEDLFQL